jgi:polyisoprenoid-binding protein YceI
MRPRFFLGKGQILFFLSSLTLLSFLPGTPVRYTGTDTELIISGTSTLHDWTMESKKADCSATFTVDPSGQITTLTALSFTAEANSLKSGHSSMDNNAYKALKTDKYPEITFTMTSVSILPGAGANTLTCTGQLSIAGSTREEVVIATCKPGPGNSITVSGSEKISMKDFQIDPPTFAFGTVRTGNDIVLTFHLTLKKA